MPKLNITHLPERLKERLAKLERGEEVSKKDIEALLDEEQIARLNDALAKQDVLRKIHKRPKTDKEAKAIGWKTKLEVRIDTYKQSIEEVEGGMVDGIQKLQQERENKVARVFLDGYFKAEQGNDKLAAGNIALTRAGFNKGNQHISKRDKEVWETEETLRKEFAKELSKEEKEQLAILNEHEKALKKR